MQGRPVLYVIASGAAPARDLPALISALTGDWDTCVIATPEGARFFDVPLVEELTGHPVRTSFKDPDAPDVLPPADAFAAAPATFNTINKWAAGISDTLALGLLNEAVGLGLPIVTVPWPNVALARHPAFGRSISTLRDCGVTVLLDLGNLPDDAAPGQAEFPWGELRAELGRTHAALAGGGRGRLSSPAGRGPRLARRRGSGPDRHREDVHRGHAVADGPPRPRCRRTWPRKSSRPFAEMIRPDRAAPGPAAAVVTAAGRGAGAS